MKCYYTGYSVRGWIPGRNGRKGKWRHFATEEEYREAYKEATSS